MNNNIYERQAVRNLQRYLRQLAHTDSDISTVPVDGIFDSQTKKSLMEFQQKYGLEVTGVADRRTWDVLFEAYSDSIERYSPPEKVDLFPRVPDDYELDIGDNSFIVATVQYMLREISRDFGSGADLELNGVYDDKTAEAVKSFQLRHGFEPHGRTDKRTWDRLTSAHNLRKNEYTQ